MTLDQSLHFVMSLLFAFDNKLQITSKSVRLQVASSTSSFAHYFVEEFYSFMKSLEAHILVNYIIETICTHEILPLHTPRDNIYAFKNALQTQICV